MSETNKNVELKQKLKKYGVFVLMGIMCAAIIWGIFSLSDADEQKEQHGIGFNADIPDPKEQNIIGNKKDAYEQEQMKQKQNDRMQSLQDYAFILGEAQIENDELDLLGDNSTQPIQAKPARQQTPIGNSVSAYQDINRTLGNFYESPKEDPEKEELKQRLEDLEAQMSEKDNRQDAMDEQVALMERSYELAAKYMPQGQNQGEVNNSLKSKIENYPNTSSNRNTKVNPVRQISNNLISGLGQQLTNEELFILYDQPRNFGFNTMDAKMGVESKNTILACVQGDQTLINGESIRLRLLEPLMAGETHIPINTSITGQANIQGERLEILISSLEYKGEIIPVEMMVYDTDAQKGIYIPNSLELNAIKEIAANMGQSMGTSISITDNAGSQIASDLTRGLIQGTSQYMAKKIRQVKVTIKSGYKIYLLPKENN